MSSLKTCFLIDDDEDDREIFQLALEHLEQRFHCVTTESSVDALRALKSGSLNPDYIFLDLNMPIMSGKECLIEIRKMEQFEKTPVLIYTTSSVEKDKDDVMQLGATSFITKPSKVSALTKILKEILTSS